MLRFTMPSLRLRIFGSVIALALLLTSVPTLATARSHTEKAANSKACVIVDNDFDIDDMMAIPLVVANTHVSAIVQSEGYTTPEEAAPVVNLLVNGARSKSSARSEGSGRKIPVIVGSSQAQSPDLKQWPWLPFFRTMMNRGNGLLKDQPKPWPSDPGFAKKVANTVKDCESVTVFISGTYTSFNQYLPLIKSKVNRVVIMGQPIGDQSRTPGKDSFNCVYDFAACQIAMPNLAGLNAAFVEIPRFPDCVDATNPPSQCYSPNFQMVAALKKDGLAGRLRQALLNDIDCASFYTTPNTQGRPCTSLSTWEPAAVALGPGGEMLLWDQTAALFLVHPQAFSLYYPPDDPTIGGKHYEATLVNGSHAQTVARLRALWVKYTNASR